MVSPQPKIRLPPEILLAPALQTGEQGGKPKEVEGQAGQSETG
jgi:hypothetical protein